jgi:hypothetical protein
LTDGCGLALTGPYRVRRGNAVRGVEENLLERAGLVVCAIISVPFGRHDGLHHNRWPGPAEAPLKALDQTLVRADASRLTPGRPQSASLVRPSERHR